MIRVTGRGPLRVVEHAVGGLGAGPLLIAVLSDLHVGSIWTTTRDLERYVGQVRALGPDLILLAGDFLMPEPLPGRGATAAEIAGALAGLDAPLGVYACLGNHDWRDCPLAQATEYARNSLAEALPEAGIRLLVNEATPVAGTDLWLVGFDSQRGHPVGRIPAPRHDPEAAFADVPDGAEVILMAHEPDYFAERDDRAALQVSGHTHGGQMNLFGWRPLTPSRYGSRYAWGHHRDGNRHLVVSGGVGYSGVPLRIAQPPELTLIRITPRREDPTP